MKSPTKKVRTTEAPTEFMAIHIMILMAIASVNTPSDKGSVSIHTPKRSSCINAISYLFIEGFLDYADGTDEQDEDEDTEEIYAENYVLTPKGQVYVDALLRVKTPVPTTTWVVPKE